MRSRVGAGVAAGARRGGGWRWCGHRWRGADQRWPAGGGRRGGSVGAGDIGAGGDLRMESRRRTLFCKVSVSSGITIRFESDDLRSRFARLHQARRLHQIRCLHIILRFMYFYVVLMLLLVICIGPERKYWRIWLSVYPVTLLFYWSTTHWKVSIIIYTSFCVCHPYWFQEKIVRIWVVFFPATGKHVKIINVFYPAVFLC
jgi:hypothetical protein